MDRADKSNVLIAGGGVAALEAALALRALAEDRVNVELLADETHFWYRPLAVAEPFQLGEVTHFELADLAAQAGATFSLGTLVSVDVAAHLAYTAAGTGIQYDILLIACGAVPKPAVPGAVTFRGPADTDKVRHVLGEIEAGEVRKPAFALPWGSVWSLPLYELALMTTSWLAERSIEGIEVAVVTPEDEPLQLFGRAASDALRELLDERGIAVHSGAYPAEVRDDQLLLVPEGAVAADRVIALPRLQGQRIDGLPQTIDGFVPVDAHGRVTGTSDVYAAGDITNFPVKQGGIAAQQADAAAEAIAADAGAELSPQPFRPVLRGLLLTGTTPRYLRREIAGGAGETSTASTEPLWWPPAKIVGRHFAPFLASVAGTEVPRDVGAGPHDVAVEVELGGRDVDRLTAHRLERVIEAVGAKKGGGTVGDVMSTDPLVVAPEDTLGEVAEKMRERDFGSALVADFGRLIGILTSRDLLRAFAGRVHSSEARVREWMTAEPIAVSTDTALEAAAILMTEHAVHHLPVVEGEQPVGMVGLRDVTRSTDSRPVGIGLGF